MLFSYMISKLMDLLFFFLFFLMVKILKGCLLTGNCMQCNANANANLHANAAKNLKLLKLN